MTETHTPADRIAAARATVAIPSGQIVVLTDEFTTQFGIQNPTNTGNCTLALNGLDRDGNPIPGGQAVELVLGPGESAAKYTAPPGSATIGVGAFTDCGPDGAELTYDLPVALTEDADSQGKSPATASFDFNVDVKLTDVDDPTNFQYINMTIGSAPPGSTRLVGTWRGASVFVPSSGGEFDWDGRPAQREAFAFDGPSAGSRLVLGLNDFAAPGGGLPQRGATGGGAVVDPSNPGSFLNTISWEIT